MAVKSASAPRAATVRSSSPDTAVPTPSGTPNERAAARHSRTSLRHRPAVKPKSKVRGNTARGHLSCVALLRPLDTFSTSIMRAGSSPALLPIAMPSAVIAIAQAPSRLLTSFMVWPAPARAPM